MMPHCLETFLEVSPDTREEAFVDDASVAVEVDTSAALLIL